MNSTALFAVFHLNLAFSSIPEEERPNVIAKCYWPLLKIIETHQIPLGIELTGFTLQEINNYDPAWVTKFSQLLNAGKCELIASGQAQIIGPITPYTINVQNLRVGRSTYKTLLNHEPEIAYINEQAFSDSLLDIYIDEGFRAIFMEWDNAYSLHPEWPTSHSHQPVYAISAQGRHLPVIWNRSIIFQKLQRACHQDISQTEYLTFIEQQIAAQPECLSLYGNDAEVFNYRPGRFNEEAKINTDEWAILTGLFQNLATKHNWIKVSDSLTHLKSKIEVRLTTAEYPIVVKKQNKYNINRWGLSGRNDLFLNSLCHEAYQRLSSLGDNSDGHWKTLLECWGSDYRTHITEPRYLDNLNKLQLLLGSLKATQQDTQSTGNKIHTSSSGWHYDQEGRFLRFYSNDIDVVLNMAKGGCIHRLKFSDHTKPLIGTIEHGEYSHISLAADFFSNYLLAEIPADRKKITDLAAKRFSIIDQDKPNQYVVSIKTDTQYGIFEKRYTFTDSSALECSYIFPKELRPEGYLRLGTLTLLSTQTDKFPVYSNSFGGQFHEKHTLTKNALHGKAVSTIVSSSSCAGESSGQIIWGIEGEYLKVNWDPAKCPAIPMIHNQIENEERLSRLIFSLSELDETHRDGGKLLDFNFKLSKGMLDG
ncbi:hypothetical protein ACMXYW_02405 [Neptuniibacter sp. QD48_55]|uniref:hypothetical protein n=1 Tax=Neptuniibacter sp. QD48_55 TaxID=3398212 RepID=UPI0039F493C6